MGRKAVNYLFYLLCIVFTAGLLVCAVCCWRASFISPEQGPVWSFLSLMMPVVVLLNLLAGIWWLVRRKWLLVLMPLAALAVNGDYIASMIQLSGGGESLQSDLRVASFNVHGFSYSSTREKRVQEISDMMLREKVGVLCIQEFLDSREMPVDSIAAAFAGFMPYFVCERGQAILSRYPILDHLSVRFPDTNNGFLSADLFVERDTVRIISVHLQTTGFAAMRRHYRKTYQRDMPLEAMFEELDNNGRVRAGQVEHIRNLIDTSSMPVVVVGDFNDTPSSYTYRRMKGDLTDGFRDVGCGFGSTFRPLGGVLRIDYIFYDDSFEGISYYMPREKFSDHKAVIAGLRLKP